MYYSSASIRGSRRGAALLMVLFIVMFATILSLGFLSRSDAEMACGQNMEARTTLDYVAESAVEHARGLILNPQDVASEYWTGATAQQIVAGKDYYNVTVARVDSDPNNSCNYIIDCNSYRMEKGQRMGLVAVRAELRLDPCPASWIGAGTILSARTTINGDVYSSGNLENRGSVRGDAFAGGAISGTNIQGHKNASVAQAPVRFPTVAVANYYPTYYIGTTGYSAETIATYDHPSGSFTPSAGNPAGIRYRSSLALRGNVSIEGTLVVSGDLEVTGLNNVISAKKNFPALVVEGNVKMYGGSLQVNGLALVKGEVRTVAGGAKLNVLGGLFVSSSVVELAVDGSGSLCHARLCNGPTWRPTGGAESGALEFDGVDDYVRTYDSANTLQLTADYTLSFWVKPDASQKAWAGLLSKCDPTGTINHWSLVFDSSSPRKLILYHPFTLPSPQSWDTGIRLSDIAGGWHHIAIVRSANVMKSYVDGVQRSTGTWANAPGSGNGHLNIGADCTGASDYVYKGLMDHVRVFARALDANNVYPPTSGFPDLKAAWALDEAGSDITITAAPCKTALLIWSAGAVVEKWGQAGGAFFKSFKRQ